MWRRSWAGPAREKDERDVAEVDVTRAIEVDGTSGAWTEVKQRKRHVAAVHLAAAVHILGASGGFEASTRFGQHGGKGRIAQ
jgi:hypothetical protein